MATLKSDIITNQDSVPPVLNIAGKLHGRVRVAQDTFAPSSAPSNNDVIIFFGIPSIAILKSLRKLHTQIASGVADVGLFTKGTDGTYTAVDADLFASALDISTAVDITGTEIKYESGVVTVANSMKQLWELAGESSDPGVTYYIGVTLTTAGTWSSDYLALIAEYVTD